MTGLWQVSGRNNTSYEERVELDRQYVESRSLWMDVMILVRTAHVVVTGHGAR
jgi:exopolysaccharide production protein ExoY